ncbi:MAG: glycosyltransferase, partial [Acidimicrobiia bacterium]
MRLRYVIQRYGAEVAGGAEVHCRHFATRLVARGHEVEVLTSCARDHVGWANVYPAGVSELDGVSVRRLPVGRHPDPGVFSRLNGRANRAGAFVPAGLARRWITEQGPVLPDLRGVLAEGAGDVDVTVFFTYLFWPTWAGLPVAAATGPTVLHPTAHDEAALGLPLYDTTFTHPDAFAFSSPEEADLVRRRRHPH